MVYGRVIGNELRDVPPEYLPVWGQRWSGYRAPHGPSPFSTRVFSVDRMSEVGPVLTSPTQFEVMLTEEDEAEDTSSESSQFRSFFLSSPLAIQTDANEPTSRPETPVCPSVHRSSNHPHDGPGMLHWGTGRPSPQKSTRCSTTLLPSQQSEQSGTQHPTSEPMLRPLGLHYGIPGQGGHGSLENDYALWDMDRTSTSIQLRDDHSYPSGQLQISPRSIPEWQCTNAHTHSSAYSVQLNTSSRPDNGCLLLPYEADDRTHFIPTMSPSSSRGVIVPLPQQDVAVHSSLNHESSMRPEYPLVSWPQWSTLPNPPPPWPLQNSMSPLGLRMFYPLVPDRHGKSTHPEGFP